MTSIIDACKLAYVISEVYASGFPEEVERMIGRMVGLPIRLPRPFSCCECLTVWCVLAMMLWNGWALLPSLVVALVAPFVGALELRLRIFIFENVKKILEKWM